jgi:hypothetical protein
LDGTPHRRKRVPSVCLSKARIGQPCAGVCLACIVCSRRF